MTNRNTQRLTPFACLFAVVVAVGCQSNPTGSSLTVPPLDRIGKSPDLRATIEEGLLAKELKKAAVPSEFLNDYLNTVGKRLLATATAVDPRFTKATIFAGTKFVLVDSPRPAAIGTGGRYVYLTTGLFQQFQTEDDLAAAMAHAFVHNVRLDNERWLSHSIEPGAQGLVTDQVVYYHFVWPDNPPTAEGGGGGGYYSDEQQEKTEALAYLLYVQGGWDPDKFERIPRRTGHNPLPRPDKKLRRSNEADDATFVQQIVPQAKVGIVGSNAQNVFAMEYLQLLPSCYGPPPAQTPGRAQLAKALWDRVKPAVAVWAGDLE